MGSESKYYFDEAEANRAINFVERYIHHVEGAKAGELLTLEYWQKAFISKVIGTKVKGSNIRRYRKVYLQIPRGNGKSTLIGALCNYFLFADSEPGGHVYYAAYNKEQANTVGWRIVTEQIKFSSELNELAKINLSNKFIQYRPDNGDIEGLRMFKTLSRETKGQHGLNPSVAILDEYHTHATSEVHDTILYGMRKRRQPLMIIITTAGEDTTGPCYREYEYAKAVLSGAMKDEKYYAEIYESHPDDDIFDEQTWIKCNPNYFAANLREAFLDDITKIKNDPTKETRFRIYALNQWISGASSWIPDKIWMRGAKEEQKGQYYGQNMAATVAFDLSSTSDITALSLIVKSGDTFHSHNWFWMPSETYMHQANYKNDSFDVWVRNGHITLTDRPAIDPIVVYDKIVELSDDFNIVNIGYDPWNAETVANMLRDQGFELTLMRQGSRTLGYPTKELKRTIINGDFNHFGHPVLRWMAANAKVKVDDNDNEKVIKDANNQHKKVDGIIANIMAFGLHLDYEHNNQQQGGSYMDEIDMVSI